MTNQQEPPHEGEELREISVDDLIEQMPQETLQRAFDQAAAGYSGDDYETDDFEGKFQQQLKTMIAQEILEDLAGRGLLVPSGTDADGNTIYVEPKNEE